MIWVHAIGLLCGILWLMFSIRAVRTDELLNPWQTAILVFALVLHQAGAFLGAITSMLQR